MSKFPFNFPVAFRVLFKSQGKKNFTVAQYNVLNILFLGRTLDECTDLEINQSAASHYISGARKITQVLRTQFNATSRDEVVIRLKKIGIHNMDTPFSVMKYLLVKDDLDISQMDRSRLLQISRTETDPYVFFAECLYLAVRCTEDTCQVFEDAALAVIYDYELYGDDPDDDLSPEEIKATEKTMLSDNRPRRDWSNPLMMLKQMDRINIYEEWVSFPEDYQNVKTFCYNFPGLPKDAFNDWSFPQLFEGISNATFTVIQFSYTYMIYGHEPLRQWLSDGRTLFVLLDSEYEPAGKAQDIVALANDLKPENVFINMTPAVESKWTDEKVTIVKLVDR